MSRTRKNRTAPSLRSLEVDRPLAGRPRMEPRVAVELRLDPPVFEALGALMTQHARRHPTGWHSPHDLVNLVLAELIDQARAAAKPSNQEAPTGKPTVDLGDLPPFPPIRRVTDLSFSKPEK